MRSPFGKWPVIPSLEELQGEIPSIGPVAGSVTRPFWSVMIPAYNSGDYLSRALQSVLDQDQGADRMQIEVVDSGSTKDDPERVVRELGRGRVGFHRLAQNRGPATTFNACIERAMGHWVHILHGDDLLLPGFYEAYGATIGAVPDSSMVVGQSVIICEGELWRAIEGPLPPAGGGILDKFAEGVATHWLADFPSVVIRRSTYEAVGGYCAFFKSCCDWDMWMRVALQGPVASVPRPYALYRHHLESQTTRHIETGTNVREACIVIATNLDRLDRAGRRRPEDLHSWRVRHADWADRDAQVLGLRGNTQGRLFQAQWAWLLIPSRKRLLMVLKSWLEHRLAVGRFGARGHVTQ